MIKYNDIPNAFVAQARSLDSELLMPGNEQAAIDTIVGLADTPLAVPPQAELWALNPAQLTHFRRDFAVPTVSRYEKRANHSLSRYAALQLIIAANMGTPYGLPDQRDGVVVQDIFPRADLLDRSNSSFGAWANFNFHTDQAYSPNVSDIPDAVMLSCVRNHEQAPTIVTRLWSAVQHLDAETMIQLGKPEYEFFRGRPEEKLGSRIGKILHPSSQGHVIRLGTDTKAQTAEGEQALNTLQSALRVEREAVVLKPGETLIFPNYTTPHARPGFAPATLTAQRRWLQRVFVKANDNTTVRLGATPAKEV